MRDEIPQAGLGGSPTYQADGQIPVGLLFADKQFSEEEIKDENEQGASRVSGRRGGERIRPDGQVVAGLRRIASDDCLRAHAALRADPADSGGQKRGIAAGAATVGCCCQMVGFAVASYRENKTGGLIAQGIGTSMLQVPNIVKKPIIWLPAILSSAILGPVASAVLHMVSTPVGSGMGSAGFVGQIAAFGAMTEQGTSPVMAFVLILVMHFILPAAITLGISEAMRKAGLIKDGDMALRI